MTNLVLGLSMIIFYLFIFWIMGASLPVSFGFKSFPVICITGFLLYFSLFQIIALPMKVLRRPLSELTVVWFALLILITLFVLWRRRPVLMNSIKAIFDEHSKIYLVIFMGIISAGAALLLGFNVNDISSFDSSYYIGLPGTSVYSNTIEMFSPYTGEILEEPQHFYILNTDTINCSVMYQALNIPPLVERKFSYTIVMCLLFEMGLYLIGKALFKREYAKTGVFLLLANLVLFYSYSLAGVSHYFAYRTYEGKAITSYLYTTVILMFCLWIYHLDNREKWPWAGLFLVSVSGVAFCNTALFVIPVMIGCSLLPHVLTGVLKDRKWYLLRNYAIVLVPAITWIALYQIL